MIHALQMLNLALAFLLETAALIAFGYVGFNLFDSAWIKNLAGLGLPVLMIIFWSQFFAPKAKRRLHMPWLIVGKLIIFSLVAIGLHLVGQTQLGVILIMLVVINLTLSQRWQQIPTA